MKFLAPVIGGGLVLTVWILSFLGLFMLPDILMYDGFTRSIPQSEIDRSQILLIEPDSNTTDEKKSIWDATLTKLFDYDPKLIVFTFLPKKVSDDFYREAKASGRVVFGRRIIESGSGDTDELEPFPPQAGNTDPPWGVVRILESFHGIHRGQDRFLIHEGEPAFPLLEYRSYQALDPSGRQEIASPNQFLIAFRGSDRGLPRIKLARLLSGRMIPEVVQGKVVVIGHGKDVRQRNIPVPILPNRGVDALEFHGAALDTLVEGTSVSLLSHHIKFFLFIVIVILGFILYQLIGIRMFLLTTLLFSAGYMIASWTLLVYWKKWIPIFEILTIHLVTMYYIYRRRTVRQENATRQMLIETSVKLRERYLPKSFYDAEQHWGQLVNMIRQTLELSRTILLDRVKGDHRVREIISLGCSIEDIHEQRRDYERTPYSTAIEESGPIRIGKHSYFKNPSESEEQYLVPLEYGGRIMGFWAFCMAPENAEKFDNFNLTIKTFAGQIAELLYRREQKKLQDKSANQTYAKILRLEGYDSAYQELNKSIGLLEQRLSMLENVLRGLSVAVIFYDLFGQVLHINSRMSSLLKKTQLRPYDMTAAEFAADMSGLSTDEMRRAFRLVLFDKKSIVLPASLSDEPQQSFVLKIQPVVHQEATAESPEAIPFQTYGFLMELIEVTEIVKLGDLQDELLEYFNFHIKKNLSPIVLAFSLLNRPDLPVKTKDKITLVVRQRIREMLQFIKKAQKDFQKNLFYDTRQMYPVDPSASINRAIRNLAPTASNKQVVFEADLSDAMAVVCANPATLSEVIEAFLHFLIIDAKENSTIFVDLVVLNDQVIINLGNTGYGIPNDIFQTYLLGEGEIISTDYRRVRNAVEQIKNWGGNVVATSNVAATTKFTILFDSGVCHLDQGEAL